MNRTSNPVSRSRLGSMLLWLLVGLVGLGCTACSSGTQGYVNDDVDFSYMERCAVLPFQNLTSDRYADERIYAMFVMNLMQRQVLTVVEPGEVQAVMRRLEITHGAEYTPEEYVKLGEALGVQAIFYGAVDQYGIPKGSSSRTNRVAARFSMTETETGGLVWQASVSKDGGSLLRGLAGTGSADLYDVSEAAVNAALETLF